MTLLSQNWKRDGYLSALNEPDTGFVIGLKKKKKSNETPYEDVFMKIYCGGSEPGNPLPELSRTSDKVSLLCTFPGRVTIMRSVRFHQAEEDRTTLQMHTSPLSFQCNNTCRAWWGGRRDGLVWEGARTAAYMQKVTHTCINTWEITGSNKTHPHGKHVAHKTDQVGFDSECVSSVNRRGSVMWFLPLVGDV